MANEEKITENAVRKAMAPSLDTLKNIEKGIGKLGAQAEGGAEAEVEGARAKKKSADNEAKSVTLLEDMVKGLKDLKKSLMESMKTKVKGGFGALLAGIAAPIIIMASFFKQLALEFKFLKSLTGGGLKKIFSPLRNFLNSEKGIGKFFGDLAKKMNPKNWKWVQSLNPKNWKWVQSIQTFFAESKSFQKISKTFQSVKESLGKAVKWVVKITKPIVDFFKAIMGIGKAAGETAGAAGRIMKWASVFGTTLGKIFLPITILMGAFDFITGFMDGYKEDGIMGGLEKGLSKLFKGLLGMPLDLLTKGISWIFEKFGWTNLSKSLDSFTEGGGFSGLIDKLIKGFFNMGDDVIGWFGDTFKFGSISEALTSMLKLIWMPAILFREWLIDPVVDWLGKKFKFDTTAFKKFSVFDHIEKMLGKIGEFFKGLFDIDIKSILKPMVLALPYGETIWNKTLGGGEPDDGPKKSIKERKKDALKAQIAEQEKEIAGGDERTWRGQNRQDIIDKASKELAKMESDEVVVKMAAIEKRIKKIDRLSKSNPLKQGRIDKLNAQIDADSDSGAITSQLSKKQNKVLGRKSAVASAVATVPQSAGIDWGFISKKEGGSKTDGYVPNPEGSKSGVTIATGFDLGARNANDLKRLGLPVSLKEKLAPYLGLQGMVAKTYLDNHPLVITESEAKLIDKGSKGDALARLKKEWNTNAKIMKTPMFEELTGAQKTVAASVAFQYGSLKKAPKFRAAAQEGRWDDVQGELRNFGDDYASRRTSEADYLMAARQNNTGGQLNNLQLANANARQGGGSGGSINVNKTNNNSSSNTVVAEAPRARKNLPLG